ncbi:Cyclic pyranopterin monophosphate synthase accessory protein 1 [Phycisphaerae bacterium RAS2]|nr:Cyclic pyranopterin monophosphate synthase accessory protein 1 [Phycisphaerae bacterium RAS2]
MKRRSTRRRPPPKRNASRRASNAAKLSHLDHRGAARMVDVSQKKVTRRRAVASAWVHMAPATLRRISTGKMPKGDVFAVARLAGIAAAKRTPDFIPLCHVLPLDAVEITLEPISAKTVCIRATAVARARTGVEMEALVAVSAAALALYDMCKAVDRGIVIGPVCLEEKAGGRSGRWKRPRSA